MNGTDDQNTTSQPQGEYLKVPPLDPVAWAQLYGRLIQAARTEKAGHEYPDAPPGFMATEASLQAVIDFLIGVDGLMAESALVPLARLATALRDLDDGKAPPLLSPRQKGGKPGTDHRKSAVIGIAARCLEELIASKQPADAAARTVLAAMRKGRVAGMEKTTAATLKNWRYRCRHATPPDDGGEVSRAAWQHFKEPLPAGMGDTPKKRADALLHILKTASSRGFGETLSQQPPMLPRNGDG